MLNIWDLKIQLLALWIYYQVEMGWGDLFENKMYLIKIITYINLIIRI